MPFHPTQKWVEGNTYFTRGICASGLKVTEDLYLARVWPVVIFLSNYSFKDKLLLDDISVSVTA